MVKHIFQGEGSSRKKEQEEKKEEEKKEEYDNQIKGNEEEEIGIKINLKKKKKAKLILRTRKIIMLMMGYFKVTYDIILHSNFRTKLIHKSCMKKMILMLRSWRNLLKHDMKKLL